VLKVAYRNKRKIQGNIIIFTVFFSVRFCTQKAQQDLRYEENIDAFSMDGQQVKIDINSINAHNF
jgi:hypothetical protein